MSPKIDRDTRVARLAEARRQRSEQAVSDSRRAIMAIANLGTSMTFQAVAERAGVSVSFLEKHAELRDEIRAQSNRRPSRPTDGEATVVRGLRNRLSILTDRLASLDGEVARLRVENAVLRGEVAELRRANRKARRRSPDSA